MEKYGLELLLKEMTDMQIDIKTLKSDQHLQIRSFLRQHYPEICHKFDVWHKSKNPKKKLFKAAKRKANSDIMP